MFNELLKSNAHHGCYLNQSKSKNFFYLYGVRFSKCIINLENTVISIKRCLTLLNKFIKAKKKILFVINSPELKPFLSLINYKHEENLNNIHYLVDNYRSDILNKNFELIILLSNRNNGKLLNDIKTLNIPIISIINTNSNILNKITYPIMINENNLKSLFLLIFFFIKQINKK